MFGYVKIGKCNNCYVVTKEVNRPEYILQTLQIVPINTIYIYSPSIIFNHQCQQQLYVDISLPILIATKYSSSSSFIHYHHHQISINISIIIKYTTMCFIHSVYHKISSSLHYQYVCACYIIFIICVKLP